MMDTISLLDIPENILRVLDVIEDPDFGYNEASELISRSPVLLAEFLKLANSAVFKRRTPVKDLRVILPLFGVTIIKSVLYLNSTKLELARHPDFVPSQLMSSIIVG